MMDVFHSRLRRGADRLKRGLRRFAAPAVGALSLLVFAAGPVGAADVEGLYEAETPVRGQDPAERLAALRLGLAQVLVRVSGERDAGQDPLLAPVIKDAQRLVQVYRYRQVEPAAGPDGIERTERPGLILWARFDPAAVDRALRDAGLPVWGRSRPATLVWLAMEEIGRRNLAGAALDPRVDSALEAAAARRGVPMLLPLMDLADQAAVQFADVWGGFHDGVLAASARYQTDAVLVGRVYREDGGGWGARWSLYQGETPFHWESAALALEAVLEAGFDGGADVLAARFAPAGGSHEGGSVAFTVAGVGGLADYARASDYLGGLAPVAGVRVREVSADRVVFLLDLRGGEADLERAISLGRTLLPAQEGAGDGGLRYRLVP